MFVKKEDLDDSIVRDMLLNLHQVLRISKHWGNIQSGMGSISKKFTLETLHRAFIDDEVTSVS